MEAKKNPHAVKTDVFVSSWHQWKPHNDPSVGTLDEHIKTIYFCKFRIFFFFTNHTCNTPQFPAARWSNSHFIPTRQRWEIMNELPNISNVAASLIKVASGIQRHFLYYWKLYHGNNLIFSCRHLQKKCTTNIYCLNCDELFNLYHWPSPRTPNSQLAAPPPERSVFRGEERFKSAVLRRKCQRLWLKIPLSARNTCFSNAMFTNGYFMELVGQHEAIPLCF